MCVCVCVRAMECGRTVLCWGSCEAVCSVSVVGEFCVWDPLHASAVQMQWRCGCWLAQWPDRMLREHVHSGIHYKVALRVSDNDDDF